jgi:hypothetical protein
MREGSDMHDTEVCQALTAWWGVGEEDGQAFWRAVARSHALRPTVLRKNLALITDQATLTRFVCQSCTPGTVLRTLEDLVGEGQLSGPRATRIQACLATRIDPSGLQWRKR